jgi:pilus assembly protein CpaB
MGNLKAVVPIAVSLVIAFVGSYFIYTWIQKQQTPQEVVQVQAEAVPVVVAGSDLPWGTKLKPEMLKTTPFLKQSLPVGYFSGPGEIHDRVVVAPLKANDPVTEQKLAPVSIKTGGVSAVLEQGKRAVSVKGDKVIGIAGFINPGNRVDVLVTIEDPQKKEDWRTKTILENIMVLATGTQIEKNEKGEPSPVDVFTLAVTSEEGELLSLAANQGKLQLAMRSVTDTGTVLTSGVNIPKMLASYSPGSPPPPKQNETKDAPKVVRKWTPRPAVSVEIIKGNEISQKKF